MSVGSGLTAERPDIVEVRQSLGDRSAALICQVNFRKGQRTPAGVTLAKEICATAKVAAAR